VTQFAAGSLIRVTFEMRLPTAASEDQVDEWVGFELGGGSMSVDNPLCSYDLESWGYSPLLTDTGMVGRTEETDREAIPGGTSCRVRYIREPVAR
jgi:hypothetical protein